MKRLFTDHGFHIVYDIDGQSPIGDGFFFTVGYDGLTGEEVQKSLLCHGIATIDLSSTGSKQQGVRVTVSTVSDEESLKSLERRLAAFEAEHSQKS